MKPTAMSVPEIFDRKARALRRERASARDPFLAVEAAQGLKDRLASVNRTFERGLVVDTAPAAFDVIRGVARTWDMASLGAHESLPPTTEPYDLVVSVLSLHAVNDLPGVLVQIRRALKPDGLFVAALFGGATLTELRASLAAGEIETIGGITPRVSPMADVRELGALLQRAGFALPVADVERTTVRYREFSSLVADLRAHGETNILVGRRPLRRATLAAAQAHYAANFTDDDGRLIATFEITYLMGWVPHESQQKPLKPGSAKMRLADALGVTEQSAGDKADPGKM